jgi:subtilase family serine protease
VFVLPNQGSGRGIAAVVAAIACAVLGVLVAVSVSGREASAQKPPDPTPVAVDPGAARMRHPLLLNAPAPARSLAPAGVINPTPRGGYFPAQLRSYLELSGDGRGQTIGITVAYDTPTIRADVARFSTYFGLPLPCDASADDDSLRGRRSGSPSDVGVNGAGADDCFPFVVAMPGGLPTIDDSWAVETALDVEWAHAIAPRAKIVLVEAVSVEAAPLFEAIDYAADHGATVISNSWLDEEFEGERIYDRHCRLVRAVCVFASGDDGHEATYPAVNPYVLAVGGTTLSLNSAGDVLSEQAWRGSGGGVSQFERRPRYQADVNPFVMRGSPDVSYNADIRTGFAVFVGSGAYGLIGWLNAGGTSAGTPQWAAIIAVANQLREAQGKHIFGAIGSTPLHAALYSLQGRPSLFDVSSGSNGTCGALCNASTGYDFVTGLGSPRHGVDTDLAAAP